MMYRTLDSIMRPLSWSTNGEKRPLGETYWYTEKKEGKLILFVELAGYSKDDVDISLNGENNIEIKVSDKKRLELTVSDQFDARTAEASMENGLLSITFKNATKTSIKIA